MPNRPDPADTHGSSLEGWYWRLVEPGAGRVLVALCGVVRPSRGAPWGVTALAAHPGAVVRWGLVDGAGGEDRGFGAWALPQLRGTDRILHADLGDSRIDVRLHEPVLARRPALGPAHRLPGLPQYWHVHVAHARVEGEAVVAGERWELTGAHAYAEKNWGPAFAPDWWWGQATLDPAVSVSFAGGRIGPLPPTAAVLRLGSAVHRFAPPLQRVTVATAPGAWRLRARSRSLSLEIEGEAAGRRAHLLPVPDVARRAVHLRSEQHLAARLRLTVREGRRVRFSGETDLAGLERGLPPAAPRS